MKYTVRKPTREELEQLRELLAEQQGGEQANHLVQNYWFVVVEDYISDSPGYCGKLLLAVYGLPELHQLYGWIDGKLVEIERDKGGK